jgi:hypothetical protein
MVKINLTKYRLLTRTKWYRKIMSVVARPVRIEVSTLLDAFEFLRYKIYI